MTLREEIEAYLATFHEGAEQQRYHLENFLRWRADKYSTNFGCHCDLEPGMKPDDCVIDQGVRSSCVIALRIERKEQCEYWKRIAP